MEKKNRDFELFKKEFTKWQEKLGLTSFKVYFKYESLEDRFASIRFNTSSMVASVGLNDKLPKENKPFKDVKFSARHEVSHLLIAKLEDLANHRYVAEREIDEASEELANKIADLLG
jgi:SRSO17 transposase